MFMMKETMISLGVFAKPITLIGAKRVQNFMKENGFQEPFVQNSLCLLSSCDLCDFSEEEEKLEKAIKTYGPNERIDSSIILSPKDKSYYIKFKADMFGSRDTWDIILGGDEKTIAFMKKNVGRIYRLSYSMTVFYWGKTLWNIKKLCFTIILDSLNGLSWSLPFPDNWKNVEKQT
jgi:hypothetical protein